MNPALSFGRKNKRTLTKTIDGVTAATLTEWYWDRFNNQTCARCGNSNIIGLFTKTGVEAELQSVLAGASSASAFYAKVGVAKGYCSDHVPRMKNITGYALANRYFALSKHAKTRAQKYYFKRLALDTVAQTKVLESAIDDWNLDYLEAGGGAAPWFGPMDEEDFPPSAWLAEKWCGEQCLGCDECAYPSVQFGQAPLKAEALPLLGITEDELLGGS